MNLRGIVVPIIALRDAFGLAPGIYGKFSVIVVINLGAKVIGMLVDAVSDVVELEVSAVDLPSELDARVDDVVRRGDRQRREKFIVVLDIGQLVARAGIAAEGASSSRRASLLHDRVASALAPAGAVAVRDQRSRLRTLSPADLP